MNNKKNYLMFIQKADHSQTRMETNQPMNINQNSTNSTNSTDVQKSDLDYYYTQFNGEHVGSVDPRDKSFEGENGKVTYKEILLQYNYGTSESPIIDGCYFECPIVSSFGGIQTERKTYPSKTPGDPPYVSEKHSICLKFDLQDEECKGCLSKWDELYKGTCHALNKHKGKVGLFSFSPENPAVYKHPIYYKMDTLTCERVQGVNPVLWVKLNNWKNNKTLFTDLNENPVDWSLLKDVEVKMIPLLQIEKIYVGGGKASLQIKLVSAIITDIAPINTRTRQTRTIDRLRKNKGLADNVASQLALLRMDKQDHLDGGNYQHRNAAVPRTTDIGSIHQIPSSNGNVQGSQDTLNAYLGGAPAINSTPLVQSSSSPHHPSSGETTPSIQLPVAQAPTQGQYGTSHQLHQALNGQSNPVSFGTGTTNQPVFQIQ